MRKMPSDLQDKGPLLRAAVIGCGRVGAIHAEALATHGRVELVAVCDPLLDRAAALARRWGGEAFRDWQTLLASTSPDIVAIATPDDSHVEPTLASLESGSHVFCEKPLAMTLAGATTMVATAKTDGADARGSTSIDVSGLPIDNARPDRERANRATRPSRTCKSSTGFRPSMFERRRPRC